MNYDPLRDKVTRGHEYLLSSYPTSAQSSQPVCFYKVVNKSLNKTLKKIDIVCKQSQSYVYMPEIGYEVYIIFIFMNTIMKVQ